MEFHNQLLMSQVLIKQLPVWFLSAPSFLWSDVRWSFNALNQEGIDSWNVQDKLPVADGLK